MRKLDLTGKRYGRLVVIQEGCRNKHGGRRWKCRCNCGQLTIVFQDDLKRGHTRSCGCLNSELTRKRSTIHGMHSVPEYRVWIEINQRCANPKSQAFENYGARGIVVCETWGSFEAFFKDMGKRPTPEHTIERVDNDKGYFPKN